MVPGLFEQAPCLVRIAIKTSLNRDLPLVVMLAAEGGRQAGVNTSSASDGSRKLCIVNILSQLPVKYTIDIIDYIYVVSYTYM